MRELESENGLSGAEESSPFRIRAAEWLRHTLAIRIAARLMIASPCR